MPSVVVGPKKNNHSILNRSESLRSEISDASLQSKKVSFNNDVRIRRIPHGGIVHGQLIAVVDPSGTGTNKSDGSTTIGSGYLWINSNLSVNGDDDNDDKSLIVKNDFLTEAETILKNVNNIQCHSSPTIESLPKLRKRLERSKSELFSIGHEQRSKSELANGVIGVSEFLDVSSGSKFLNHSKGLRIRKPVRRRVGLDTIGVGGDNSSSSGSDTTYGLENKNSEITQHGSSAESPLSSISISSDVHENIMSTTPRHTSTPRVSSMVTKLGSIRREQAPPPLRSSFLDTSYGNTHNNNKPFSYTGSGTLNLPETFSNGHTKKGGREVIYAQVVSGEKKDGTPEKRTIHKKYSDLTTTTSSESPDYQKHIRHFVFDKENNWKNYNGGTNGDSSLLSTYKTRNSSQFGSKNNVTTVLLNSHDEEDSLRSTTITNNDLFTTNPRSSSSPPTLTDRPFFYGDSRHARIKTFDHSSSSSPQFQYSSSSREQSPAAISAAKLVRDAEKRKGTPSSKLITSFGQSGNNHTDYQYMTTKLGYLTPSEYSTEVKTKTAHLPPRPIQKERSVSTERRQPRYEVVKPNGWNKTSTNASLSSDFKRNPNFGKSYTKNNYSVTTSEKNRKNSQESTELMKKKINTLNVKPSSSSSGGLISSLMRRNKDKKNNKEKIETSSNNDGKVKQRNKFLSLFFDKSSTNKKNDKLISTEKSKSPPKSKLIVTDSEIDDAERKRDGEYHSWSSVDGSYHFEKTGLNERPKEKISRGKSYNFGDYRKNSEDRWYNNEEQEYNDYGHDLGSTQYKSATLGRPIMRSSVDRTNDELIASRTKSLDRRNLRTNRIDPPPQIIVTPNSPPVDETGYTWEPKYPTSQKAKLGHKLSKSSVELNTHHRHFQNGRREMSPAPIKVTVSEKLRYFGDTDVESVGNQKTSKTSRFNSSSKIGQMDHMSNGNHVSRRDTLLRKIGRHDGINSSEESESRMSRGSSNNVGSLGSRSVFLHAPTVAEIPPPMGLHRRTLSKDEISNYSGPQKQTRHLARSMSVLAPWRPRNHREKYEVHYDEEGKKDAKFRRPPKPPRSPNRKSVSPVPPPMKHDTEFTDNLQDERISMMRQSTLEKSTPMVKRSKSMSSDFAGWLTQQKGSQKK